MAPSWQSPKLNVLDKTAVGIIGHCGVVPIIQVYDNITLTGKARIRILPSFFCDDMRLILKANFLLSAFSVCFHLRCDRRKTVEQTYVHSSDRWENLLDIPSLPLTISVFLLPLSLTPFSSLYNSIINQFASDFVFFTSSSHVHRGKQAAAHSAILAKLDYPLHSDNWS